MINSDLKTLEEKLSYAYDTKVAIHDAIVAKGTEIQEGTVFRDYAGLINEIKSNIEWKDAIGSETALH